MENYIALVKEPELTTVQGFEALSIGESFNLFFKEVSSSIDKRLATLSKSVHTVDPEPVRQRVAAGLLYVKNTGVEILTPEGFAPGLGNMMAHTQSVVEGIYLISSLRTEASRLYDWVKQIIKTGRVDTSFNWTVSDFDTAVGRAENFLRNLPDNGRSARFNLGQVYISLEEFFDTVKVYNNCVRCLGSRDIELVSKELSNVYSLGNTLSIKIKSSDIRLSDNSIQDIETVVQRFINLTNVCGAMMVLLNELSATFNAQIDTLAKLK